MYKKYTGKPTVSYSNIVNFIYNIMFLQFCNFVILIFVSGKKNL